MALVHSSGRPVAQIAKEPGVNHETLRTRVRAAEAAQQPGAAEASVKDAELARLREEVAELKLEREILRKAAPRIRQGEGPVTSRFSEDGERGGSASGQPRRERYKVRWCRAALPQV